MQVTGKLSIDEKALDNDKIALDSRYFWMEGTAWIVFRPWQ